MRALLGCSDGYGRFVAHQLVRKGWLERLRPGLFQLIPADRGREGVADSNPLAAGAVLVEPYYFSFGTACTHHGLTEQVFTEVYMVADFKGHDLRRTVHTLMGKLKIRKFDRALVLNHVRPRDGATRADDVYDLYEYDDEKMAALEKWSAFLAGLGLAKSYNRI